MNIYDKLLELTASDTIQLAGEFRNSIGKELVLGQTRYMCRNGTLSAGHEIVSDSATYYQAIKEMHTLASNMRNMRAQAKINQAKIIRAQKKLDAAVELEDKLEAEGELAMAQEALFGNLSTCEDQTRMLDEYNKIRLELKPIIDAKYPEGIEQAEKDRWTAVLKHRIIQRQAGLQQHLTHVPMDKETAARIGYETGNVDLISWLQVSDPKKAIEVAEDVASNIRHIENEQKLRLGLRTN